MSTEESAPVKPGDVLAGKYQVERILGIGGMGVVVSARHLQLEEKVALKFMLEAALVMPEAVQRFLREARAAARLKSEHVAKVTDVGTLENGAPYMVMEYLEGQDLSNLVQVRGRLEPQVAVDYVLQACEALAEAHSLGIVHRDLKPANLFLSRRADGGDLVKVLDFGISKVSGPGGDMGMTKTTAVMGSPLYMSPEQMKSSKDVDARADIWALGVILYELLSGLVPFEADSMPMLIALVLSEPPRALLERRPDLPPALVEVVGRCLQKTLDLRFANVAELAEALAPFASHRGQISVERIMSTLGREPGRGTLASMPQMGVRNAQAQTMGSSMVNSQPAIKPPTSKAPLFVGLGVAVLAIVGLLVVVLGRTKPADPTPTSATPAALTATATASADPSAAASVAVTPVVAPVAATASASAAATVAVAVPQTTPAGKTGVGKAPAGGTPPAGKKPPVKAGNDDDAFGGRRLAPKYVDSGASDAIASLSDVLASRSDAWNCAFFLKVSSSPRRAPSKFCGDLRSGARLGSSGRRRNDSRPNRKLSGPCRKLRGARRKDS